MLSSITSTFFAVMDFQNPPQIAMRHYHITVIIAMKLSFVVFLKLHKIMILLQDRRDRVKLEILILFRFYGKTLLY